MNGRVYSSTLGRMLSPDPVTQAPENGQNYNRYSYANNNPLKYSDPSGFCFSGTGADSLACGEAAKFVIASAASYVINGIFGGNGCDRTCKDRHAAHNWCKAQSACLAELRANTREKFRRRSAQVILEATQTGQSYYYENGRAYLGAQNPVVGATGPAQQTNAKGGRGLTPGEIAMGESVFPEESIDYDKVQVFNKKYFLLQGKNYTMAPNGNIYFNPKGGLYRADFSQASGELQSLFIHELTHVGQYQNGVNVLSRGLLLHAGAILTAGIYSPYSLSGYSPGRSFSSYNIEQQGSIAAGVYNGLYENNIEF